MYLSKTQISAVSLALLLAGCNMPMMNSAPAVKATPAQVAKYKDLPALGVVETLEKNFNAAKANDMPFLAPRHFRDASQILSKCQSYLGNKAQEDLVNCAVQGDAVLEKGRGIMDIVKYRFTQELAQKAQLDALNTEKLLPKEYARVMGDLSGLIDIVEREQPNNIDKEKDAVLKAMQGLEVQAVQEGALHESEMINADSKKKNADKQAPVTFAEAQRVYQESMAKIATVYRDQLQVQRLGAEALFAARHARQVNDRVALLQSQLHVSAEGSAAFGGAQISVQSGGKIVQAEKVTLEKIVLQEEGRLLEIARAMGLKDMRDQPLDRQVDGIRQAAADLASRPRVEADTAALQDMEARLKAATEANRQALAQVAEKDRQLEERAAQLDGKDAQIKALTEKISQLEKAAAPAAKNRKPAKSSLPAKQ